MLCDACIRAMGDRLREIARDVDQGVDDSSLAGGECAFCERLLTAGRFSLHRWIFGICDICACSIASQDVDYAGPSPRGFNF